MLVFCTISRPSILIGALNYLAVVDILCVAHSGNGTEVELPQITCGGKLSNFEFSTYCPPRTGLARRPVPMPVLA